MAPRYTGSNSLHGEEDIEMEDDMMSSQRTTPCPSEDGTIDRLGSAISHFALDEETDEGRLSRALQTWMPDHQFSSLEPMEKPPYEIVFSGRLGGSKYLKHASSEESIVTQLSLLTCSSGESVKSKAETISKKTRRKTRASGLREARAASSVAREEERNRKWDQIAMRRKGHLSRMMKQANALAMSTYTGLIEEDDILYELLTEDERKLMARVGRTKGLRLTSDLKKSSSMTNIKDELTHFPQNIAKERLYSAGVRPKTKAINLEDIRQQRMNAKLAQMQKESKTKSAKNRRQSLVSELSDVTSGFSPRTPSMRSLSPIEPEERISIWKGDNEILEMDLRQGLTSKATKKIKSTTAALERVTGFGEHNSVPIKYGRNEEFPFHVEEDYGCYPKIVHRIRVSPHLSDVIKTDIKIRMGRPRYHEIRKRDIDVWTKGQKLDKAHTNLKVFNWLHSLREGDFQKNIEKPIYDVVPNEHEPVDLAILHVESADEPDAKPLYLKKFELS